MVQKLYKMGVRGIAVIKIENMLFALWKIFHFCTKHVSKYI